jgi:hypothetical protein
MSDTNRLALPLLAAAQAQKHVTVNDALMRLDGLVNLVLTSVTVATPPVTVLDGMCYGVPAGAVNGWSGRDGAIAIGSNGGWVFATPAAGWRAYVSDAGVQAIHSGVDWVTGALSLSSHGAGLKASVNEVDHVLGAEAVSTTVTLIPSHAMVIGVSARVVEPLTGTLTSWKLGNAGAEDRFGSGLGVTLGSWAKGMLGQPLTYWTGTPLVLTAEGGLFSGGTVRIAVHYLEISLPSV